MEIYRWLSVMWRIYGNIQVVKCDVDSVLKHTGG